MSRLFVWTGGTLFVASLALCAWWYVARLGDASPAGGWPAAFADAALLTVFALHHSIFARQRVKARLARVVPADLERSLYVWIASALLIVVVAQWRHIGGTIYRSIGWAAWAHGALQLCGVWLIARSVAVLDPLELAGIRRQASHARTANRGPVWVGAPSAVSGLGDRALRRRAA